MIFARFDTVLRKELPDLYVDDPARKRPAFELRVRNDAWRIECDQPNGETRHPDLTAGVRRPRLDQAACGREQQCRATSRLGQARRDRKRITMERRKKEYLAQKAA